jgi:hypothetical protein
LFLFCPYARGKQNLEAPMSTTMSTTMSKPDKSDLKPQSDADELEAAADQAIAACGGDAREAVKALIVANRFLETDLEKVRAAVSLGYTCHFIQSNWTLPHRAEKIESGASEVSSA